LKTREKYHSLTIKKKSEKEIERERNRKKEETTSKREWCSNCVQEHRRQAVLKRRATSRAIVPGEFQRGAVE